MKSKSFLLLVIIAFLALCVLGVRTGSIDIDNTVVFDSIIHYDSSNILHYIILNLRLPRVILAFLVGGALSISGYLMQTMVNNPLADPYILGTASGASLGASIIHLIIPISAMNIMLPSLSAFVGAMIVTLIAVFISYNKGQLNPTKLLLAGVALSSLMIAIISFLIFYSSDDSKIKMVVFWSMGSFDGARWEYIPLLLITLTFAVVIFSFMNRNIQVLLLGESRGGNLGLNVKGLRWMILITASILTGFSVATCGPVGFVGLIVPHFTRGLFGITGRHNLLYATLLGGVFMMACDFVSLKLYPPVGMPIGIITSFLGIPFFVYLLSRDRFRFS